MNKVVFFFCFFFNTDILEVQLGLRFEVVRKNKEDVHVELRVLTKRKRTNLNVLVFQFREQSG